MDDISYKTIVDENGYIVDKCVLYIGDKAQFYKLSKGQKSIEFCNKNLIKGKYENGIWIETATEEEIYIHNKELNLI